MLYLARSHDHAQLLHRLVRHALRLPARLGQGFGLLRDGVGALLRPTPHKDFSDLYGQMSGEGASASGTIVS